MTAMLGDRMWYEGAWVQFSLRACGARCWPARTVKRDQAGDSGVTCISDLLCVGQWWWLSCIRKWPGHVCQFSSWRTSVRRVCDTASQHCLSCSLFQCQASGLAEFWVIVDTVSLSPAQVSEGYTSTTSLLMKSRASRLDFRRDVVGQ